VHFWLNSDRVGDNAIDVTMTEGCKIAGDTPVLLSEEYADLSLYEEPAFRHPAATVRHYVFTGGCVTARYSFTRQAAIFHETEDLLGFKRRSSLVNRTRRRAGVTLCGAEAPPCPG
jgi:hypothetical protein